jgi:hypothetical protein
MVVPLVADIFVATNREVLSAGPPAWELAFSWQGTVSIGCLGLVGVLFLNASSLRGLWDSDLAWTRKTLIPCAVGVILGIVSLVIRVSTDIDNVLREFLAREDIFISLGSMAPYLPPGLFGSSSRRQ